MAILFKNNAASTLTYKMTNAQEVLYVADASVFPVIAGGSGDVFKLTLVGEDTLEIVEAYAAYNPEGRQGFRIRRAQEGTTAQAWPAGTRVELRITADALNSFVPTAVQIAKDYVDATGVASTTNVGFAGVDGKTTKADAEGVITAKDVAIGGNLADLATARGQLGPAKELGNGVDYNTVTEAGFYLINASDSVNGPLKGSAIFLHVFYSNKGALTKNLYQIAYAYSSARERMFIRQYRKGSNDWSSWSEILSSASIGDGIRINNGIISVPEYKGATASTAGTSGLVPPATAGQHESFLTGGGEYKPALTKISDSVNLADSKTAASAKAVKAAYERGTAGVTAANGKLSLSGGVMSGRIGGLRGNYNADASSRYATGALEIRENGGVGNAQSDIAYAPTIGFHWANRVAGLLALRSDGTFSFMKQNGTRAVVDCDVPYATAANKLRREGGVDTHWWWSGQGGQPGWLWGGNDGANMYVYNPANFSVNYANSAGRARLAATAMQWVVNTSGPAITVPQGGTYNVVCICFNNSGGKGAVKHYSNIAGGTVIPNAPTDYMVAGLCARVA